MSPEPRAASSPWGPHPPGLALEGASLLPAARQGRARQTGQLETDFILVSERTRKAADSVSGVQVRPPPRARGACPGAAVSPSYFGFPASWRGVICWAPMARGAERLLPPGLPFYAGVMTVLGQERAIRAKNTSPSHLDACSASCPLRGAPGAERGCETPASARPEPPRPEWVADESLTERQPRRARGGTGWSLQPSQNAMDGPSTCPKYLRDFSSYGSGSKAEVAPSRCVLATPGSHYCNDPISHTRKTEAQRLR